MNNIHIRDQRLPGHFWSDNIAYDVFLRSIDRHKRPYAMATYMALCRYANNQTGEARISMARLSNELGMSANTIRKSLNALHEHRLIEIERKRDEESGINYVNTYILLNLRAQIPPNGNSPRDKGTSPHEVGGTSPHEVGVLHHMNPNNTSVSRLDTKDSINSENSAVVNIPLEENPLSAPLTIPHEVIPIITPTITPAPTEEKPTIPTLQVESSVLPERGSVSGISTDKPEVKPKRRAKKETKPKLALYSNKELFDILLAFSFPGSDPDAVMPLIGKLRKTLADYIYTKNKGEELTPERTERFLAKMRGLEGWYKANHKDDGYRPKFPNPFMATIGAYFGTPTQAENVLKERVKCPDCNGEGMKISRENLKPGQFYETIICATCNGAGKIYRG